jgi:hypothetical protein
VTRGCESARAGKITALRRVLNLVADAAIAAIDALNQHDTEGLDKAMGALSDNAETARLIANEATQ